MKRFALTVSAVLAGLALSPAAPAAIDNGSQVALEYTLTLASTGELVQSNVGEAPLVYVQGNGKLLPALEAELLGHEAGDEFDVALAAEDAYGPVNPDAYRDVAVDQVPEEAREVGAMLSTPGYQGSIRVHEVRDDAIVLDFNHPLAGEDLKFRIRVVSVAAPSAPAAPEENGHGEQGE